MNLIQNKYRIIILSFLIALILGEVHCKNVVKRGIMDNINNGIRYAGQMFGINTASDVANLVAKAFSSTTASKKQDTSPLTQLFEQQQSESSTNPSSSVVNPSAVLGSMLKLIGFDSGKLGALAVNAIIMIAQMIGNAFNFRTSPPTPPSYYQTGESENYHEMPDYDNTENNQNEGSQPRESRRPRNGSPLDWILENPSSEFSKLFQGVQNEKLPEYLTEIVDKMEQEQGEGDCIKMLLCKSSPFIWGMQRSIANRFNQSNISSESDDTKTNNNKRASVLYKYLPDIKEYRKHGELCELKYANYCKLMKG